MLFNSLQFLIFFPVVTLIYFPLPQQMKKPWLLVCSYYFYMCWNAGFAILILISTLSTWACGFLIERAARPGRRTLALVLNLVLNLGLLFFFKYFDFFSESLFLLLGSVGIVYAPVKLSLTLPVGISFYTFQALGYSIDVYRRQIPHEKSLLNYALFVSFFPQLVAGPIERSANFLPQLHTPKHFDEKRAAAGLTQMLYGFFKKMVIADGTASFVNLVYGAPAQFSSLQLLFATVLFAIQIYCDFSGYSDIALGAAQVLGYKLMRNFDAPYFSHNLSEFWQRWHISLSTWFEDYIFTPLVWHGKNPKRAAVWGLLLVFFISGLWHGAAWTFVAWGLLHGIYRVAGTLTRRPRKKLYRRCHIPTNAFWFKGLQILFTFTLVCFSYIFFRANTMKDAFLIIRRLFAGTGGPLFSLTAWRAALQALGFFGSMGPGVLNAGRLLTNTGVGLTLCILLLAVLDILDHRAPLIETLQHRCYPLRYLFCFVLALAILLYGSFEPSGFYYFQF